MPVYRQTRVQNNNLVYPPHSLLFSLITHSPIHSLTHSTHGSQLTDPTSATQHTPLTPFLQLADTNNALQTRSQELRRCVQERDTLETELSQLQQAHDGLERRLQSATEENTRLASECNEAQRLQDRLQDEGARQQQEAEELKAAYNALADEHRMLSAEHQHVLADCTRLSETARERDVLQQTQRGREQEVEQIRAAAEVLRHDKERLGEELLQVRAQVKREARAHTALCDDLQRQLDAARSRAQQDAEALAATDASGKHLREDVARLQRELDAARAEARTLSGAQNQVKLG